MRCDAAVGLNLHMWTCPHRGNFRVVKHQVLSVLRYRLYLVLGFLIAMHSIIDIAFADASDLSDI
jgi:hypothetical protein